jgi:GT2 family glycosyltransferase
MGAPDRPRVRVIVPSWNGRELLDELCLPSLSRQDFDSYEILVVDNGSTDGTQAHLATSWPSVAVISLGRNQGFAAAVNAGVRGCRVDYIAVVNNDVELERTWLSSLVELLDGQPFAASATGKMLWRGDRTRISSAGDVVTWDGMASGRGRGSRDVGQFDRVEPVLCATGGASLYRRTAFDAVGVFDEDFFAYLEDVDWGMRAQLLGFDCWYTPAAVSYHVGGATSAQISGFRVCSMLRNMPWLIVKTFPASRMLRHAPRIVLSLGLRTYRAIRATDGPTVARTWAASIALFPRMARKRRSIQTARRRPPSELDRLIARGDLGSPRLARLARHIRFPRQGSC